MPVARVLGNRPKCQGPNTINVQFKFFPAGNSGTTPLTIAGDRKMVTSVVRNGTAGEFLVTMADAYRNVMITPSLQLAAAVDQKLQLGTVSNENTSTPLTFIVRCLAVAAASEIAANANNVIHIAIQAVDSSAEEV